MAMSDDCIGCSQIRELHFPFMVLPHESDIDEDNPTDIVPVVSIDMEHCGIWKGQTVDEMPIHHCPVCGAEISRADAEAIFAARQHVLNG